MNILPKFELDIPTAETDGAIYLLRTARSPLQQKLLARFTPIRLINPFLHLHRKETTASHFYSSSSTSDKRRNSIPGQTPTLHYGTRLQPCPKIGLINSVNPL